MLAVLQGGMQRGADSMDGHKTKLVKLLGCIYHNVSLRVALRRPQRVLSVKPTKTTAYPAKSPQNVADEF